MVKIQCQIHVTDYDGFLLRPNNNKKNTFTRASKSEDFHQQFYM